MTAFIQTTNFVIPPRTDFNTKAETYDGGIKKTKWIGPEAIVKGFSSHIDFKEERRNVLDIGAGTGRVGEILKGLNPDTHITGIEPAEKMIEIAVREGRVDRPIIGTISDSHWHFKRAFNAVACAGVLDFVQQDELELFVDKVTDALEIGGVFGVTVEPIGTQYPGYNTIKHDPYHLAALFAKKGARITDIHSENLYESFVGRKANQERGLPQPPVENFLIFGRLEAA